MKDNVQVSVNNNTILDDTNDDNNILVKGRIADSDTDDNCNMYCDLIEDDTSCNDTETNASVNNRNNNALINTTTRGNGITNGNTDTITTNERLLSTAFVSFSIFAITQMIFAFIAQSESMKGDSSAMLVDSLTYLINYIAERKKKKLRTLIQINNHRINNSTTVQMYKSHDDDNNNNIVQIHKEEGNENQQQQYYNHHNVQQSQSHTANETHEQAQEQAKYDIIEIRKSILLYEIVPPLLSVTTLLIITAIITNKAAQVLWYDLVIQPRITNSTNFDQNNYQQHESSSYLSSQSQQQQTAGNTATTGTTSNNIQPNMYIMLTFSSLNLLIDIVNVCNFAWAHHLLGYQTVIVNDDDHPNVAKTKSLIQNNKQEQEHQHEHELELTEYCTTNAYYDDTKGYCDTNTTTNTDTAITANVQSTQQQQQQQQQQQHSTSTSSTTNLNMCSAYTHVIADTLRSSAVMLAVFVVWVLQPPNITPEIADATAAIVVTAIILGSLLPLGYGLYQSLIEYMKLSQQQNHQHHHHHHFSTTITSSIYLFFINKIKLNSRRQSQGNATTSTTTTTATNVTDQHQPLSVVLNQHLV